MIMYNIRNLLDHIAESHLEESRLETQYRFETV